MVSPRSPEELDASCGLPGALRSRRGQHILVKLDGQDMRADTKRDIRWIGKHTTAAVCIWDLPCPGSTNDALLLFRRLAEELIKAQDKSLLTQVSLLCHLLQQYLTLCRKARAALQEAQEWYKPKSLKCQ